MTRRFPIVSGFRVSWDSRRPAGQRVLGVWLVEEPSASRAMTPYHSGSTSPAASSSTSLLQSQSRESSSLHDLEEVKKMRDGRKYRIITREYMAEGHDGFEALKGHRYLVDDESGQLMSAIVRKYLLGASLVKLQIRDAHPDVTPWALRRLPLCESPLSPGEYARCEAPRP